MRWFVWRHIRNFWFGICKYIETIITESLRLFVDGLYNYETGKRLVLSWFNILFLLNLKTAQISTKIWIFLALGRRMLSDTELYVKTKRKCIPVSTSYLLNFWRRNYFLILAHPVYKMWIIQDPNKLELWNKLHFEEKKRRVYTMFKIFSTYICWISI